MDSGTFSATDKRLYYRPFRCCRQGALRAQRRERDIFLRAHAGSVNAAQRVQSYRSIGGKRCGGSPLFFLKALAACHVDFTLVKRTKLETAIILSVQVRPIVSHSGDPGDFRRSVKSEQQSLFARQTRLKESTGRMISACPGGLPERHCWRNRAKAAENIKTIRQEKRLREVRPRDRDE